MASWMTIGSSLFSIFGPCWRLYLSPAQECLNVAAWVFYPQFYSAYYRYVILIQVIKNYRRDPFSPMVASLRGHGARPLMRG